MSFILDALKKSESERHRQSGPVLMDVRIAAPRRRIPVWAWVIAAVLAVNLGVLAWLLWLSPSQREVSAPAAAAAPPPPAAAPAAATTAPAAVTPLPAAIPPPASSVATELPLVPAGAVPATALPPAQSAPPAVVGAIQNTDIDVATLPRVSDMVASGITLPQLRLSLHVYDAQVQNRYVLLNGVRLREGDFTAEGVRVVSIAPTGVVVEWRSRRMFLGAGG